MKHNVTHITEVERQLIILCYTYLITYTQIYNLQYNRIKKNYEANQESNPRGELCSTRSIAHMLQDAPQL